MIKLLRFARGNPFIVSLALALLSVPAHAAGEMTRIEIDFFQNGDSEPMNQATLWVSARRVRIEQRRSTAVEKGPVLVYRGDKDLVLSISDRDRKYAQLDRHMLRMLGMASPSAQATAARREMDGQLKGLPRDQRAALERVLGVSREDAVSTPLTVTHGEEAGEVAGIECARVLMSRESKPVGDACVASWDRLALNQVDIEVFRALANFQRDALRARGATPVEFVPDQAFDLIVQFDGFPLSFRRIVDGQERSAIRVRSIARLPVDDGLFSAPSDYARRAGYGAFLEHLSASNASDASENEPKEAVLPPPARLEQAPASPAPGPRNRPRRNERRDWSYRSITLGPVTE